MTVVAAPVPSQSRLASIVRGPVREPERLVMIGINGVGKTTFGAGAPSPIFLTVEEGAAQIGVPRYTPSTLTDVISFLNDLDTDEHEFRTVVVDTLDALETLVWKAAAARGGHTSIEDYGYGKGYVVALDDWRKFLNALDALRKKRRMEVILLAHSAVKNFKNPSGPDYSRYEPAINAQAAALILGWADTTLFASFEDTLVEAQTGKEVDEIATKKRVKGASTGRRFMYTQRTAAYEAKNRWNLPNRIEMVTPNSYVAYAIARDEFWAGKVPVDPAALEAECRDIINLTRTDVTPELTEKLKNAAAFISKNRGNASALLKARASLQSL
jgi:hypothetical protein